MPLTTDTSVNFNAAAGYSCESGACPSANLEFTGGGARIKVATASGTFLLLAPTISTAGWGAIYSAVVDATEAAGYWHKFAVSFDGLTSISTYGENGWTKYDPSDFSALALADPVNYGMSLADFNAIREWPADHTSFWLATFITKEVGGGTGLINQLTVSHGTTEFVVTGEPDGSDALTNDGTNPFYRPDYTLKRDIDWEALDGETEMGYRWRRTLASSPRSAYDCEWRNRTTTHADNIEAFLIAHQDEAFVWTPPGFGSSKKFVALEPGRTAEDYGVATIRATLIEVLPA